MNTEVMQGLASITQALYQAHAQSFSHTRERKWVGWEQLLERLPKRECAHASAGKESRGRLRVCDIASGNMRFLEFLLRAREQAEAGAQKERVAHTEAIAQATKPKLEEAPKSAANARIPFLTYQGIDYVGCDKEAALQELGCARVNSLLSPLDSCHIVEADLIERAQKDECLLPYFDTTSNSCSDAYLDSCLALRANVCANTEAAHAQAPEISEITQARRNCCIPTRFDLVVSFGFMHHIAGYELRKRFIEKLLKLTSPTGVCVLSLWRFAEDPRAREKAMRETKENLSALKAGTLHGAEAFTLTQCEKIEDSLEEGDFLLSWQGQAGYGRYCHSFSDREIDTIVRDLPSSYRLLDRFCADGKNGCMNCYLILVRRV